MCLCLPFAQHPDCLTHPSVLGVRVAVDVAMPLSTAVLTGDGLMLAALVNVDPGDETDVE